MPVKTTSGQFIEAIKQGKMTVQELALHWDTYAEGLNGYYFNTKENALFLVIRYKMDLALFQYLLENNVNSDSKLYNEENLLHYLSKFIKDLELATSILTLVLQKHPNLIQGKTLSGETPLDYAIKLKNSVVVLALLKAGASFETLTLPYGRNLLHVACEWRDLELVKYLTSTHAEWIDQVDKRNMKPIDIALQLEVDSVSEHLLLAAPIKASYETQFKNILNTNYVYPMQNDASLQQENNRITQAQKLRSLVRLKQHFKTEDTLNQSLSLQKAKYKQAVLDYFEEYSTRCVNRTVGLGCASTYRRMKNGHELLTLIDHTYANVNDLISAVHHYCYTQIETGFFGRSALRDKVTNAKISPAILSKMVMEEEGALKKSTLYPN